MSKRFPGATQTRRGARGGFPEHDDFEGLPVRQWRQEVISIAPPAPSEPKEQNDRWAVELPHGLPKEFPLLPPHTQELLRAARSGRLYKRSAEEEEPDADGAEGKGDKKDVEAVAGAYTIKAWRQVPRNNEGPTVSHLAKRPRNIVTISSKAAAPIISGPTARRVTVRKMDAAGNPYERTITLSEGQVVDGEIISETIIPAPAASTGDLTRQLTPVKKRPPPPKRKPKGPGRGRKKGMLPLPLPTTRGRTGGAGGDEEGSDAKDESDNPDGIKTENNDSMVQDSEMAEHSALPSDEEDDEGEDQEGAENDEGAGDTPDADGSINRDLDQDLEMSDAPGSVVRSSTGETDEEDAASKSRLPPPPPLGSLAPLHGPLHLNSPKIEGSPLKNVMIQSPTDHSPMASPHILSAGASFAAASYMEVRSSIATSHGSATSVSESHAAAEVDLPMSSRPSRVEELASSVSGAFSTPTVEASGAPPPLLPPQDTSPQGGDSHSDPDSRVSLDPPKSPALRPAVTADEDDGLNLLGSLERELDRQEGMSNAGSEQKPTPPAAGASGAVSSAVGTGSLDAATKEESPVIKEEEIN